MAKAYMNIHIKAKVLIVKVRLVGGWKLLTERACTSPGRGFCLPPGELPALQLVGELSCPPQTSSAGQ